MLRSLSDIQAFVQVARTLSFTKAAGDLHVTTTAVSKAVARLENDLDTQLFVRTTRHVRLTEEGELFLARCIVAVNEIEAGREAIEVLHDEETGPVRISTTFILGRHLAASLPNFMARHPKVAFRVMLTDTFVNLEEDRVDIAIRIGDLKPSPTYATPLAQLNWVTVASPRYLQQMGFPTSPDELFQHKCHHFVNPNGVIVPWTFKREHGIMQLTPRGGAEFNQGELLVEIALADGGIVQVFDYMIREALRDGKLIRLFHNMEAEGPMVYAVTLPGRESTPKIKATLHHLHQLFDHL